MSDIEGLILQLHPWQFEMRHAVLNFEALRAMMQAFKETSIGPQTAKRKRVEMFATLSILERLHTSAAQECANEVREKYPDPPDKYPNFS